MPTNKVYSKEQGSLYLVATPIGNLGDITFRAVEVLKTVDCIAAEDTRHSIRLLNYYGIKTPLLSLHAHNEKERAQLLCNRLKEGLSFALISDAGTPLISDPGYRLVRLVKSAGIPVVPIPGACALVAALVASGLPTTRFVFEGFISSKGANRRQGLIQLKDEPRSIILYESVHRIFDLIKLCQEIFGPERLATIAREMTKKFEEIVTAPLQVLETRLNEDIDKKGEFVVIIEGAPKDINKKITDEDKKWIEILLAQFPLKLTVQLMKEATDLPRNLIYQEAMKIISNQPSKNK